MNFCSTKTGKSQPMDTRYLLDRLPMATPPTLAQPLPMAMPMQLEDDDDGSMALVEPRRTGCDRGDVGDAACAQRSWELRAQETAAAAGSVAGGGGGTGSHRSFALV